MQQFKPVVLYFLGMSTIELTDSRLEYLQKSELLKWITLSKCLYCAQATWHFLNQLHKTIQTWK